MKLALGTVQFGLNYGVANKSGQVRPQEVSAILQTARAAGITMLDTAIAYGESEARLGSAGVVDFRVVSKLPGLEGEPDIVALVQSSTARLGIAGLYGLLLHRSSDLAGARGDRVYSDLLELKQRGLVQKIGVSIYDPSELAPIMDRFELDIVQAPYNLLDRRLASSGWLTRLKSAGVEVHTRSAFLQGLLLMAPGERPAKFARWSTLLSQWDGWLADTGIPALDAALAVACGNSAIDQVIVGVDSASQLMDIVRAAAGAHMPAPDFLRSDDTDLINPANWNAL
ncbi:MAG: aldo/keto reductase [Cypionkella sp.]